MNSVSRCSPRRLAGIVLCLALTAVACGGSDVGSTGTPLPTATVQVRSGPTPPPQGDPNTTAESESPTTESTSSSDSGGADQDDAPVTPTCADPPLQFRTDLAVSGSRVFEGPVAVNAQPLDVALGADPVWVLPLGDGDWYVTLANDTAVVVSADGSVASADALGAGAPPVGLASANGAVVVSAYVNQGGFNNPLPDTRVVHAGQYSAALVSATDRYPHGVLGDSIEAAGVEVLDRCTDTLTRIDIAAPSVIEGISPMLADLNADGTPEVIVTVSNAEVGARIEAYAVSGEFVASSAPIGRANRWRNQMGVAPLGPKGEAWLVDVRTPHIGGTVEFFALEGDELVLVANSTADFTSHVIGTRNLDMGVLADATGDGRPEVLVLTARRDQIAVLEVVGNGVQSVASLDPGATVVTNIAVQSTTAGSSLAIGTAAEMLRIWAG